MTAHASAAKKGGLSKTVSVVVILVILLFVGHMNRLRREEAAKAPATVPATATRTGSAVPADTCPAVDPAWKPVTVPTAPAEERIEGMPCYTLLLCTPDEDGVCKERSVAGYRVRFVDMSLAERDLAAGATETALAALVQSTSDKPLPILVRYVRNEDD